MTRPASNAERSSSLLPLALAIGSALSFSSCKKTAPAPVTVPTEETTDAAPAPKAATTPIDQALFAEADAVVRAAITAYNDGDAAAFAAAHSEKALPAPTAENFQRIHIGYYRAERGRVTGTALNAKSSVWDKDRPVIAYAAKWEIPNGTGIRAILVREDGKLRLMQLNMN